MIRVEAEELFIAAIMSGEKAVAVEMDPKEAKVFRVLLGRTLKEMEHRNKALWIKARNYGVTYKEPYLMIQLLDSNRFKLMKITEDGAMEPITKLSVENIEPLVPASTSKIDSAEEADD